MGFSQEMKDFIAAYDKGTAINARGIDSDFTAQRTDALTKKTALENDPERIKLADDQLRANLAKTRALTAASGAASEGSRSRAEYNRALIERMRRNDLAQTQTPGSGMLPPGLGVPVAPGAVPGPPPLVPTIQYAEGGLVEDDDEIPEDTTLAGEDLPDPVSAGAVPLQSDVTDFSAQSRRRQPQAGDPHQAVKEAYKYGANAFNLQGTGAVRTPQNAAKARALAQGQGALSSEEVAAAGRIVDPEGKMPDGVRNMAAIGAVYQHWANKGDPEKAQKVAFQMLQHYRLATQRYAAIAAHAAEQGNVDLATKAALKAYANVPDGRDIQIVPTPDGKLQYNYVDENGKTISKGIATPQQLAASAMGLAQGGFDQAILSAAGAREASMQAVPVGRAPKEKVTSGGKALDERAAGSLDETIKKHQEEWAKAKPNQGKELDQQLWNTIRNAATHVQQTNPSATPDEVVTAVNTLMAPPRDGEKPFKTTDTENGVSVKFKTGQRLNIDNDTFDVIMNENARLLSARKKAEQAVAPDRGAEATGALGRIGGAVARDVEKFGGEVSAMVPNELKQRGKSAVGAVGRAATDVARVLTDPKYNMGTLVTAIREAGPEVAAAVAKALRNKETGAVPVDAVDSPL